VYIQSDVHIVSEEPPWLVGQTSAGAAWTSVHPMKALHAKQSAALPDYSSRRAAIGSAVAARRAGTKLASMATTMRPMIEATRVSGSWGFNP
jgi:hypothetical protein